MSENLLLSTFVRFCRRALTLRYTKAAIVIQKTYRMVVVRQLFLMIRDATVTIQAFTKGTLARRRYRQVSIQCRPLISLSDVEVMSYQ